MSDSQSKFHFALARITTLQILKATGIDKAKPSVVDSLTDILVRYMTLLGSASQAVAGSAGRHASEMEDLREALESVGALDTTSRLETREEAGIVKFISWCMSDEAANIKRVAGGAENDLGEDSTSDWLSRKSITLWSHSINVVELVQKQVKVIGEESFKQSPLKNLIYSPDGIATKSTNDTIPNSIPRISGLETTDIDSQVMEIIRDHSRGV